MIENYFSDIDKKIGELLIGSKISIDIAVAWLTDNGLVQTLCLKSSLDRVKVRIIISDDKINFEYTALHKKLEEAGVELFIFKKRTTQSLMHNKFCIIDSNTIITGSYNWTKAAIKNLENIVVVKQDDDFASNYNLEFQKILRVSHSYLPSSFKVNLNVLAKDNLISDDKIWEIVRHFHSVKFNPSPQRVLRMLTGTNSRSLKMKTSALPFCDRFEELGTNRYAILKTLNNFFTRHKNEINKEFRYEERGWNKIDFPGAKKYFLYDEEKLKALNNLKVFRKSGSKWTENERLILAEGIKNTNDLKMLSKITGREPSSIVRMAKRVLYEHPELLNDFLLKSGGQPGFETDD